MARAFVVLALVAGGRVFAAPALHAEIDRLIDSKAIGPTAAIASDAEFLRRVTLDLAGDIPTSAEARAFLADASPTKRTALIDRLLASPGFARRMQEAFNIMLMERRTGADAASAEWNEYLRASFESNKPLDQLAREILAPDADNPATRAAAVFYTKRLENVGANPVDHPRLARDIGRLFLGKDLQCAQCHNHLIVKEYKQLDFQGLFAFVGHTSIRREVKFPAVAEGVVDKRTEFMSVFAKEKRQTGPRLPDGDEVEIPAFKKGEEFAKPPDKKTNFAGTPKFSTVKALGEQLPKSDAFARNLANRLWFQMMGRGLVHPLDMHHAANPPSHPELLDLLAARLREMKFDARAFLREVALSRTYQRSSILPSGGPASESERFSVAALRRMSAEQLERSVLTATADHAFFQKPATAPTAPTQSKNVAKPPSNPTTAAEIHKQFLIAFANPAGEAELEFAPSLAGALFLSNSQAVLERLKPRAGNLIDRLTKLDDAAVAEELYLSVLTRMPEADERAEVAAYLGRNAVRRLEAFGELTWSLLASTEFCVTH